MPVAVNHAGITNASGFCVRLLPPAHGADLEGRQKSRNLSN
jgi:hypothetical protein